MMNLDLDIVGLKRSQINEASEVLARAFNDDPMFRYLTFEGDRARANALKWFCKLVLRYSEPYNHIYTTASELKGIATWVPPGHFPLNMLRLLQVGLYALPFNADWRKLGRMKSLFDKMEEFHKRDMPHPHWYLFMLGVAPTYQGQGIGGLLLQPVLKQIDQALNLLQQKLVHISPGTSKGSFAFPTPQPLPRTLPLLRWFIGLVRLSQKTRS